jgi:hypothetical protein
LLEAVYNMQVFCLSTPSHVKSKKRLWKSQKRKN